MSVFSAGSIINSSTNFVYTTSFNVDMKMKKIKIIAGIIWALSGLILILILFPGLNSFSGSAARLPFMKINPNYSGGEVTKQMLSGNY